MLSKKIILIAGPTASGKSKLSIQIANKLNGEIINADSMQIYKEFSILSSRPNIKETMNTKHHMLTLVLIKREYKTSFVWLCFSPETLFCRRLA